MVSTPANRKKPLSIRKVVINTIYDKTNQLLDTKLFDKKIWKSDKFVFRE